MHQHCSSLMTPLIVFSKNFAIFCESPQVVVFISPSKLLKVHEKLTVNYQYLFLDAMTVNASCQYFFLSAEVIESS